MKKDFITVRLVTFGVIDSNSNCILRGAINENDLIALVEKGVIISYELTDDYIDITYPI